MNAIKVRPGVEVVAEGRHYQISRILDLECVLAHDVETGETRRLPFTQLLPSPPLALHRNTTAQQDLQHVSNADWQRAQARFAVIQPLLEQGRYSRREVQARAQATGYSIATLYRWLRQYQRFSVTSALVSDKRGPARGQRRLCPEVNTIIDATIHDTYLSAQKPSMRHTALEVERRCRNAGLQPPHPNTVRHHIVQLSDEQKRRCREGHQAARAVFEPLRGPYADADWPLAVWQIDHTPVDIILVDRGLPWRPTSSAAWSPGSMNLSHY